MTNKDNVSRETIEINFDKLLENAVNSYEKILDLMKITEEELNRLGLIHKVSFSVWKRCLIFRFEHEGKIIFTHRINYDEFTKAKNGPLCGLMINDFLCKLYADYVGFENNSLLFS